MKKLSFAKKKKVNKSLLKRKCDMLFSRLVRSMGFCHFEGKDKVRCTPNLQCMHIIGRSNLRLRWDMMNCLSGCSGHHMYYTHHPLEFIETIMQCWPDRYKYVVAHRNELNQETYEETLNRLKAT